MDEAVMIQELSHKISDVQLAKNLKRRSVSAEPELEEGEIPHEEMPLHEGQNCNSSHKAGAVIEEGHAREPLVAEGQNGKSMLDNDGASDQWWMKSKVYPPPKRRSVSAIRRYPPGCGRNPDFTVAGFDSERFQCEKINGNSEEVGEAGVTGSVNNLGFQHIADEHAKHESLKRETFGLEFDDPKLARDLDNRGAERFKGKGVNVDSKCNLDTTHNKPIKIKIRFKAKQEEASKTTVPLVKSPTERVKKSPMKVIDEKRVGIKCPVSNYKPSFPRIDRRESGDVDLEEYGSLAIMQSKSKSTTNFRPRKDDVPTDPRAKVKRCLRLFQVICRKLLQEVESGKKLQDMEKNRIDLRTASILGERNETLNRNEPVVGAVPGVEVGDEYRYRAELSVLGLHRPPQAGIDFMMRNGIHIATSIVASGGYSDDMENENVLIYTGAGGKPTKDTEPEDQKLKRGNLALKNSIETKTPVRVIHGQSTSNSGKVVMTFTYDGLYRVEKYWREKETYMVKGVPKTVAVFKFQLQRLEGQPELNWSKLKKVQRSKVREGLCFKDISLGKEKLPICVINTIDNKNPRQFQYITKTVYPGWYQKTRPRGCTCKGPCSDAKTCSCAGKNGGQIPFNFNGAIVKAKRLIYECGPMCGCPPSCYNRVSQHGIKYPLEVFKTEKRGWGVRSLSSIPSGSFVCEYIGELLQDLEAEQRKNDEYLFDIGHNYDDSALWEGLLSDDDVITDEVGASLSEEGYTIDALERGNVGRFINHSCSPNLYAQNVLFDHDDKKMPHVMFFACENIPPLKELTYHYNYGRGQVHDSDGSVKVKECYCGASECKGRLY